MSNDLSAGTRVKALDFPESKQVYDHTDHLNMTGTTYSNGSPEVGVRFQAASSGRAAVTISTGMRNNTTANEDRIFCAFQVYVGDPADGVEFQSEEVKLGMSNMAAGSDDIHYGGHLTMLTGLVPGEWYYARFRHRVTLGSGTADLTYRKILVFPIP